MLEVVNVDEDHNLPFRFATKPKYLRNSDATLQEDNRQYITQQKI